jgi:hypothetical protein
VSSGSDNVRRHCERSDAIQRSAAVLPAVDCFVALPRASQ